MTNLEVFISWASLWVSPYTLFFILESAIPVLGLLGLGVGGLMIARAVELRPTTLSGQKKWGFTGVGATVTGALFLWLAYCWAAQPLTPLRAMHAYLSATPCVQRQVDVVASPYYELSLIQWRKIEGACSKKLKQKSGMRVSLS